MVRLRVSRRTSLCAPQQPRNPQPESIARNPYHPLRPSEPKLLCPPQRIMSIESLVRHLGVVEDPRCQGKIEHRLIDILVVAICAVIACAESWCDIALYGRSKLAWLRTFLELPN